MKYNVVTCLEVIAICLFTLHINTHVCTCRGSGDQAWLVLFDTLVNINVRLVGKSCCVCVVMIKFCKPFLHYPPLIHVIGDLCKKSSTQIKTDPEIPFTLQYLTQREEASSMYKCTNTEIGGLTQVLGRVYFDPVKKKVLVSSMKSVV